jgi:hypothetical protein
LARKSKYIRLYLYSGKFIIAATYLRRVFVDGRSFAAGAPALTYVFMYRWRLRHKASACRGQVCGGMLGAMSRIAPPQPHEVMARVAPRFLVPQPNSKQQNFAGPQLQTSTKDFFKGGARDQAGRQAGTANEVRNFTFSPAAVSV